MAWNTPKTTWKPTDFVNKSDINRIVNNLEYLKSLAESLYEAFETKKIDGNKNFTSDILASEINAIESNLEVINKHTYNADIGETKTYYPNDLTIDYNELNRIEKASETLFNKIYGQLVIIPHFEVVLSRKNFGKRTQYDHNEIIANRCGFTLSKERKIKL